jgi:hypothetical protein
MPKRLPESSAQETIKKHLAKLESLAVQRKFKPPFDLSTAAFEAFMNRMQEMPNQHPDMAFWFTVRLDINEIHAMHGMESHLGVKIQSRSDFYQCIHPDYLEPYFQWVSAILELTSRIKNNLRPLENSIRISLPIRGKDGQYNWYSQHSTVVQIDSDAQVYTYLNTYYFEGKWSALTLKPFESFLRIRNSPDLEGEQILNGLMVPYIIDEFTNSELEVITFYTKGMDPATVASHIGWSRHTLNEYNAAILKKARRLFQFNFRTAREFSMYCLERGFIYRR